MSTNSHLPVGGENKRQSCSFLTEFDREPKVIHPSPSAPAYFLPPPPPYVDTRQQQLYDTFTTTEQSLNPLLNLSSTSSGMSSSVNGGIGEPYPFQMPGRFTPQPLVLTANGGSALMSSTPSHQRSSWANLVASQEVLTDGTTTVRKTIPSHTPGTLPLHERRYYARTEPRTRADSNHSSSAASEFILVPSPYHSTAKLPTKNGVYPLPHQQTVFTSLPTVADDDDRVCNCGCQRCGPRNVCFWLALVVTAVLLFGILGYLARGWLHAERTFVYNWYPPESVRGDYEAEPSRIQMVLDGDRLRFQIDGKYPFNQVNTTVDLSQKLMLSRTDLLPDYCFVTKVQDDDFSTVDEVKTAAKHSERVQNKYLTTGWKPNWHYEVVPLNGSEKHFAKEFGRNCRRDYPRIMSLRQTKRDMLAVTCKGCVRVCLPRYGLHRLGVENVVLNVLEQICVWAYVPEWEAEASSDQRVNQDNFLRYYRVRGGDGERTQVGQGSKPNGGIWVDIKLPRWRATRFPPQRDGRY